MAENGLAKLTGRSFSVSFGHIRLLPDRSLLVELSGEEARPIHEMNLCSDLTALSSEIEVDLRTSIRHHSSRWRASVELMCQVEAKKINEPDQRCLLIRGFRCVGNHITNSSVRAKRAAACLLSILNFEVTRKEKSEDWLEF